MKSLALFMTVLALSLSACRNTSLNLGQGGSSLKGVYDNDYSLQISQVPEKEGLYQFEVCLLEGSSQDGCVAALKNGDQSVTFSIETLSAEELALSNQEQRNLLKMQSEWGAYKAKQESFKTSQVVGATIGGAAVIGSTASMVNLHNKALDGLLQAEKMRQKIWNEQLKVDGSQNPDWYKRVFGEVNKKKALENVLSKEKQLNQHGYSTIIPPERTITAAELKSKGGHVFSDEFVDHLNSSTITKYLKNSGFEEDGLTLFTNKNFILDYPKSLRYDDVIFVLNSFINKKSGRKITDIIDPNFIDRFLEYKHKDHYYRFNELKTQSLATLRADLSGDYTKLHVQNLNNFATNKGVPSSVISALDYNKVMLKWLQKSFPDSVLKNTSEATLTDIIAAFKKSEAYMNPARKLSKESAKQISRILRRSLPVIIVGGLTTVAILNQSKQEVQAAEAPVKKKELEINKLNVLLNHSSPLMSTDPSKNVEVPSVKDVLTYLALSWGHSSETQNIITHYCLPESTGNNKVEAVCEPWKWAPI